MSSVPTGSAAPSILAILAASRWARVTPRVRRPTKARSAAPPFRSRISWAMRVSARSSAASSRTCAFSRKGRAGLLKLLSLRASRGPLKGKARTNCRHSTCAFPSLSTGAGERRDDRHVVRGLRPLALVAVDLDGRAPPRDGRRHEDVVDPEPPAAVERPGAVVPPREEAALQAVQAERVAEAPGEQAPEGRALGLARHDLAAPPLGVPDVPVLGRDVDVAADGDGGPGGGAGGEKGAEAPVPVELVGVLLRADLLAVGAVDVDDPEPADVGDQQPALGVVAVVRERARHLGRLRAGEDGHAVVRALAGDEHPVAERLELRAREVLVGDLDLLQAHDVRPAALEPGQQARQADPDGVHVPGRELHGASCTIAVPARPATASATRSSELMTARPPASTNSTAASTFGPMLPGGNSPAARRRRASTTVSRSMKRWRGVPQPTATRSTPVRKRTTSRPAAARSTTLARSFSITASTPRSPPSVSTTGIPPPPTAIGVVPASTSARTSGASTTRPGRGEGATRRQPRPASSTTRQPL